MFTESATITHSIDVCSGESSNKWNQLQSESDKIRVPFVRESEQIHWVLVTMFVGI